MKEAFASVRVHLDTCRLLEEKPVPPVVGRFGWCTWDAFYLTVEPKGIWLLMMVGRVLSLMMGVKRRLFWVGSRC